MAKEVKLPIGVGRIVGTRSRPKKVGKVLEALPKKDWKVLWDGGVIEVINSNRITSLEIGPPNDYLSGFASTPSVSLVPTVQARQPTNPSITTNNSGVLAWNKSSSCPLDNQSRFPVVPPVPPVPTTQTRQPITSGTSNDNRNTWNQSSSFQSSMTVPFLRNFSTSCTLNEQPINIDDAGENLMRIIGSHLLNSNVIDATTDTLEFVDYEDDESIDRDVEIGEDFTQQNIENFEAEFEHSEQGDGALNDWQRYDKEK
jgi:hypothetical protein